MGWAVFTKLFDIWHSSISRRPSSNGQAIDFCLSLGSTSKVLAATLDRDCKVRASQGSFAI